MKLAQLPDPPPITEEVRRELIREAEVWRREISRRARAIVAITEEDLQVVVR